MYSNLDRVDFVATNPMTGGEELVQTDHRQANEVSDEPELSVIFALTRVINARRVADERPDVTGAAPSIRYVCMNRPPAFLHQAVAAAGGELVLIDATVPYEGEYKMARDLADAAFRGLAERVQRTHESPAIDEALLATLERALDDDGAPDREQDELGYWTRIVELAAVCGELLRVRTGGRWVADDDNYADVPFVFRDARGLILNVANKAKRRVDVGPSESLAQLLSIVDDQRSTGRPMLTLKAADWDGRDEAVTRPLLERFPESPLIAFGTDLPNTFAILTTRNGATHDLEALEARALETLRTIEVTVEQLNVTESLRLFVVSGDYFACEKLLDRDFMRSLEERAGVPLLAAGIPTKGLLLVTSGIVLPETMGGFMAICEGRYGDAAPRDRVSPAVFLVQEGAVCGVVRAQPS